MEWIRHDSPDDEGAATEVTRRCSVASTASTASVPEASQNYAGKHFWTAHILVPLSLPKNRSFVPTFHSCIVSRTYTLELSLTYSTPGTKVSSPHMTLRTPIQVSSEGNPDSVPLISDQEAAAIARRESLGYFEPRSVAPPSPEYTERAVLTSIDEHAQQHMSERHNSVSAAPPGYTSVMAGRSHRMQPRAQSVSVR